MKIRFENINFKAALFLVGMLVIVMDNNNNNKVSAQSPTRNPHNPACTGFTLAECKSAGSCCLWCDSVDPTSPPVDPTKPTGYCYDYTEMFVGGVCSNSTANTECKTIRSENIYSACTCQIHPESSNDSSLLNPSFFTAFILSIFSFLYHDGMDDIWKGWSHP
ncbi:hypothetical protein DFA_07205 [Cavenderia fasciculata]|uniref:Uncharacterized protein n=1 Tax=Cavenderia fasciculata TaxID=261658 RepID=F4PVS4_CACFS|nr:uncharacterized protein DFA_07205 [Cavenderia fasciculata]EGG20088.1 hypothetical protein DFA_07205 [Cavenderia fasciculata]|eukprot:XP_004367071.1 hypothetical protein DFA_07205 [Cavenderia fasciculata]